MKRILLSTAFIAVATPALASDFFFKPYIGADYQHINASYKDVPGTSYSYGDFFADSFNGGNVHAGLRIHKNIGFEGGYFSTLNENKSAVLGTTASSSAKLKGWTIDAMGYLPLGASQKFELIGTAGIARTTASGSVTISGISYYENGSETKGRIGGGAQYWFTDNLNIRGIIRYQGADFGGTANNMIIANLGANWQF